MDDSIGIPVNEKAASLDLEDLCSFIVLGVRKDDGSHVIAVSPNLSVADMGGMLGRAQVDLQMQVQQASLHLYAKQAMVPAAQAGSRVIVPGRMRRSS